MANVLITGSTGMIGKGVLFECIKNPEIHGIVLINRTPIDLENTKIKEILLEDFSAISSCKEEIGKIDACFHCMGVSAVGLKEEDYHHLTYTISKLLVDLCYDINPQMTFNYVSGQGTDSTENGSQMWARVKGKTENYILNKGFAKAYAFRPGFVIPEKGIQSRTKLYDRIYKIMKPFFPILKKLKRVTTTTNIGKTMLLTISAPQGNIYLENPAINQLAGTYK